MEEDSLLLAVGRKRIESRESIHGSPGRLHWSSGSCNEQGRYKYQEDRCVHFSDVHVEFARRESDRTASEFDVLPPCPSTTQYSSTTGSSSAYFGVFDGHAGQEASTFVSQNLHMKILRFCLFLYFALI